MALRKWDRARIIAALRQRRDAGQDLSHTAMARQSLPLLAAAMYHFGSYREALGQAGLDYRQILRPRPRRWTPQKVVQELCRLHSKGHGLADSQVQRRWPQLAAAARNHFGSYRGAIEAAGFDYADVRCDGRVWSRNRIIQILRELHHGGADLRVSRVMKGVPGLEPAARKYFGGYRQAMLASGLRYPPARNPVRWTDKRVLDALRQRHARDEELRYSRVLKLDPDLVMAARFHFGSYLTAVEKAGIPYKRMADGRLKRERSSDRPAGAAPRKLLWPPQRIIDELRRLRDAGENVRANAVKEKHSALASAARYRFGTFARALAAAGLEPPPRPPRKTKWHPAGVLEAIRQLYRAGQRLSTHHIPRTAPGLVDAAQKWFGTWLNAAHQAGVDPVLLNVPERRWTPQLVVETLQDHHHGGRDLSAGHLNKTDSGLYQAMTRYFDTHAAALEAAGIDPQQVRRRRGVGRWTRELLVAELRRLHQAGQNLSFSGMLHAHSGVPSAGIRLFGSYRKALEAAGFDPASILHLPRRWTCAVVLQEIRRLHREGSNLRAGAVNRRFPYLLRAAGQFFESWPRALRGAGIDPDSLPSSPGPSAGAPNTPARRAVGPKDRLCWTSDRILAELRRRNDAGEALLPSRRKRGDSGLYNAARFRFGSWWAALKAAGVEGVAPTRRRWSGELVIQEIQRLHTSGQPVNSGAIQKTFQSLQDAIYQYFGSHDAGLRAAGIDPATVRRWRPWTPQLVLETLREAHRQGRDLSSRHLHKADPPLYGAMGQHFGSHRKALEAAGIDPELVRNHAGSKEAVAHWTDEVVLQALRDLHAAGRDLRHWPMRNTSQPLFFAAKRLFGSYVNAVTQAGIDYSTMAREQLHRELAARQASAGQPDGPDDAADKATPTCGAAAEETLITAAAVTGPGTGSRSEPAPLSTPASP